MPDSEKKDEQPEKEAEKQEPGLLYGRKWEILIYKPAYKEENGQKKRDPEHDVAMDVSLLRCIFKCQQKSDTAAVLGTLIVYNMNSLTEKAVIEEGFQISVSAGYEKGQYGHIYTGDIVQVIRNRENGVDYRLEILAINGTLQFDRNHVRAAVAAGSKARENAKTVCEKADEKIDVGKIEEGISESPLPRGKVFFGSPGKYLRDICLYNNAYFALNSDYKMELRYVYNEIPEGQIITLTPFSGLVGTPKYTDGGINIKMLLDPRVKLLSLIKIDNELIEKQLINIDAQKQGASASQANQNNVFDESGEYQVFSITHSLDTMGDDWTTEVVGMGRNGKAGLHTTVNTQEQTIKA